MQEGAGEPAPSGTGLRLRAEDADDLAVISACLQDALVSVRDLAYDRDAGTFILVANRFRWEGCSAGEGGGASFERTLCAVAFETVSGVTYRGFHRREEERILSLLAIQPTPARSPFIGDGGGRAPAAPAGAAIDLEFAGAVTIRLFTAAIRCRVRDFGEPWPTAWQPGHALDEQP
jgi:Protein of unknown function (DUF2948)